MTGKAGSEESFSVRGIALLVGKAVVFFEFFTRIFGRLRSDELWRVVGKFDCGLAAELEIF